MSSIKVNVRSKVRLTSTGQTTFVKKVVIGTPVRSVTGTGEVFTSLNDVTITNTSEKQIIVFDSAQQKFINTDSATLVNLTVSGDILPAADSSSDLGSPTKKFKDLYLSGDTIILGSIRLRDSDGGLGVVDPATRAPKPLNMRGSIAQIRKFFSAAGDLTYNPNTGVFGIDVETVYTKANFDSDLGAALSGGAGITYDSSSDTISITNTTVTPGTYGSASQVPQIVVNPKGQILSASNVSIAGVTGVTFDSSNGALTVSTSAGSNFTDSINLNPFSTSNLSEGSNLYFTSGRADARVNAGFSAKSTTNLSEGDNLYYTTARADSAFDARFDSSFDERLGTKSTANLSEGSNLYYTTTRADSAFDARFDSSFDERLATKSTSNLSEGSNLYFTTGRADARVNLQTGSNLDLSSKSTSNLSEGTNLYFTTARADSDARHALSGSNSITYSTSTGDIRAPQPLDSAANPTFNQLRGPATFVIDPATIGDATGTVRVLGNLTVEGTTTTINSTNVSVNDKTFTIADSAADSSGLNDAGIIWGGSSITANKPSFQYNHASERFDANRTINATSFIGSVTGNVSGTAASVTNAAQTNITSLGTLTGLTSTGDVAIDSAGGFLFDVSEKKLVVGDDYSITLGSSNDFVMKHIGSSGQTVFQENNTSGSLLLKAANLQIQNPSGSEVMADFNVNGSVELYHDNIKKLETTKYGTTVTGTINADSATLTNATITNRLDVATSDTLSSGLLSLLQSGSGDASINFELVGTKGYSIGIDNSDADKFKISNNATIGTSDILSINTSGNSTFTGDLAIDSAGGFLFDVSDKALEFGDNYKATFGTGGDLEIYHDGSNSIISDGGTGSLNFRSSYYNINNAANDKSIIRGNEFGVEVLHNNSVKFSTRDSGVTITGELNVDSATASGNLRADGGRLILGNDEILTGGSYLGMKTSNQSGNDEYMIISGVTDGNTYLSAKASNNVYIRGGGNTNTHQIQVGTSYARAHGDFQFDSGGAIQFDKSDKALEFGDTFKASFGDGADFKIQHNGTNSFIQNETGDIRITNKANDADVEIRTDDGSGDVTTYFLADGSTGAAELYHYGSKKLATTSSGASVTGTLAATLSTAAQPNITSLGTLTGLTSTGDVAIDSAGGFLFDVSDKTLKFGENYKISLGSGGHNVNVLDLNNHNIIGVNKLFINDAGNQEGIIFSNIKLFESPNNMTNAGGNFQVTHGDVRRFTVSDSGAEVVGQLVADSATVTNLNVQDKLFLDSEGNTSRMSLQQVNTFGGDILRIETSTGTVDIGPANSSYSHFVTDRTRFYFNRKIVVDDILSSYNGNLELQKEEVTKLTLSDSGATVTGQLVADSATFTNATISNISNAPIFKAVGANEGGEINLEKAPNSSLDGGTYNRTVIDMNVNKFRIFTNGSARGAHLNLSKMDSNTAGSNEIVTEQTSHTFTKSQTFSDDVLIDSDGGFFFDVSDKKLALGDNYKAIFGDGSDFQIFHNGSNTFLKENGTGSLLVQASFMAITKTDGSSNMAKFFNDGAVELYHNANKKLETTSTGATVTGTINADSATFANNIRVDGGNLILGGEALSLDTQYIGMKTSYMTTNDEYMILSGTSANSIGDTFVSAKTGSSVFIRGSGNDTAHQIEVSASQAKAYGDFLFDSGGAIQFDKSDKALEFGDNYKAKFGTGGDLEIYHDGSNSYIDEGGTGNLYIRAGGNNNISLTDNAVYLYYSGSTKLQTTSTGVAVTGKITSSDSAIFDGNGSSGGVSISDGLIDIRTGTGNVSKVKFYCEASNAHFQTLQAAPHSAGSSAVIVLPTASGTLLNTDGSGASLTNLNASQLSSGTVPSARLSLEADDIPNLAASKITSGTFDSARLPAGAFGGAGGGEANQNAFSTIAVAGQSNVVADAATDTVTFVAGSNMTITTNASGDTVTFTSTGGGGGGGGGLDSADVLTVTGTASISGVSGNLTVAGALSATTKSFDIEHPTQNGKRLRYGSLEGPENGVYVRGRIKGINKIKLPDYWTGLVDEETITVNITPIGSEQCLFVEDIQSDEVIIGGGQDIDCFYTVYGERKDVDKLKVEYES